MFHEKNDIVIFLIVTTLIIISLSVLILILIYLHQKKLILAKLETRESTLQHISREIHDNVNFSLRVSKAHLSTLNMLDERETEQKISSTIDLLSKSIKDLCCLSKSLGADEIDSLGLKPALTKELEKLEGLGFIIESQFSEHYVILDKDKELVILRVAQEALNNVIKHSTGKIVRFNLTYYNNHLKLIIEDNGAGFEYPLPKKEMQGAGLNNIRMRAQLYNGTANILSTPGKGTSIHLSIPY